MDKKYKIGRNEPCPCGSGKKYKKCCGAVSPTTIKARKEIDYFKLNKEVAYKGKIGREREEFCIQYIKHKQALLKKATLVQIEHAKARGETITCHKGCSFCCAQHVPASLQECEAIVYYLYQNEKALGVFLNAYPRWKIQVEKIKGLLKRIGERANEMWTSGFSEEGRQVFMKEAELYATQNIPCPFLSNDACLIYEVRPWACASIFATTPAEWCNLLRPEKENSKPKIYIDDFGEAIELPFYYKHIKVQVYSTMPLIVHGILKGGFLYLSKIPGLENLPYEVMSDPEVKAIVRSYYTPL